MYQYLSAPVDTGTPPLHLWAFRSSLLNDNWTPSLHDRPTAKLEDWWRLKHIKNPLKSSEHCSTFWQYVLTIGTSVCLKCSLLNRKVKLFWKPTYSGTIAPLQIFQVGFLIDMGLSTAPPHKANLQATRPCTSLLLQVKPVARMVQQSPSIPAIEHWLLHLHKSFKIIQAQS